MHKSTSFIYTVIFLIFVLIHVQCKEEQKNEKRSLKDSLLKTTMVTIQKADYGTTSDNKCVEIYTLKNQKGMEVKIITYGGIITSLKAPDRNNGYDDIILGYDSLSQYISGSPYFGAIIGRYGNRIAKGKFSLDGTSYSLSTNDGQNHLHGGEKGLDKVVWDAAIEQNDRTAALKLNYLSRNMEEGYPGNLNTTVTYSLSNDNTLDILYEATTDIKTVVNLTQHSYFNLSANFSNDILKHEVTIYADSFLPVDATLIPNGDLKNVTGTPFDFREAKAIGKEIEEANDQLEKGLGYDHCWVLNNQNEGVRLAASAYEPESGRMLEIFTDQPGIQFYSGNFLDNTLPTKQGGTYAQRTGFCLETQHYPDSPNQASFPSTTLNPGEKYETRTSLRFTAK
ncbi:aldose epimerase family protein [Maribacter sp. ACAM166]|uniref:aldose epimerase family protein n=1 Tax=Maribacter sp. ACAM166 TaxID=2508996 RepID=UPI0010FEC9F9|nr:galactose mutarotase [Maribacter sp. ACAM166]